MNHLLKITQLINGLLLVRFSLSKLFAWPISVQAFVEMAKPLGIDPTFFRLFTGVVITTVCLGYLAGFYLLITKKAAQHRANPRPRYLDFVTATNLLGIAVMLGALGAEFFLRVAPKWPLVFIALFIVVTSVANVLQLKKLRQPGSATEPLPARADVAAAPGS